MPLLQRPRSRLGGVVQLPWAGVLIEFSPFPIGSIAPVRGDLFADFGSWRESLLLRATGQVLKREAEKHLLTPSILDVESDRPYTVWQSFLHTTAPRLCLVRHTHASDPVNEWPRHQDKAQNKVNEADLEPQFAQPLHMVKPNIPPPLRILTVGLHIQLRDCVSNGVQ